LIPLACEARTLRWLLAFQMAESPRNPPLGNRRTMKIRHVFDQMASKGTPPHVRAVVSQYWPSDRKGPQSSRPYPVGMGALESTLLAWLASFVLVLNLVAC